MAGWRLAYPPLLEIEMSKKQPKLTDWFISGETPTREGVYEVFWNSRPVYAKYIKAGWRHGMDSNKSAAARVRDPACEPPQKWRGLAEKPN
jgi:hypothetical protein